MISEPQKTIKADGTEDTLGLSGRVERRSLSRDREVKIGLALGSGVARGWAHIGVIRELEKEGIVPDVIAGTSIGAVVGGAYAADGLDQLEEWALSLKGKSFFRFLDIRFGGSGLFGSEKLDALMTERFGSKRFKDLTKKFAAVACDLKTGHEIWLQSGDLTPAIRASFALPGVFEAQNIDDQWLVDGALVNPVPVSVCRALGCELVIAVNLSEDVYGRVKRQQDENTDEEVALFEDTEQDENRSFLSKLFSDDKQEKTAPSFFNSMANSLNIMQNRIARSRLAGDPPDITIAPRCGHIGLMEFHRAEELIEEGAQSAAEKIGALRDAFAVINMRINS